CDRLARDGLYLLLLVDEFEKAGAKVVFVTEPHESTPEGQLLTYVRGWASKLEALKIKERTVRGRKQRAKNGRLPANGKLYGYLYMKGKGESRGIRIPDVDKAKVVQDIFSWYVNDGLSLEGIQKRLYALGIAPPGNGSHWQASTVFRLLSNPAYAGKTITNWTAGGLDEVIEVVGATPAIIDLAVFDAARERLRLNKENAKRRGKKEYLLRGMLFCACGRRMVGASPGRTRSYRCTRHNWEPDRHCGRQINAENIEAAVWSQIKGMLADPKLIKEQIGQRFGDRQGTVAIESQIQTIDARLKALAQGENAILRQLRLGLTSEPNAEHELRQGKQDRETLERERSALQSQLKGVKLWAEADIDGLCRNALINLESPTHEIKRAFLQAFDTKIAVEGSSVKVSVAFPIEPTPEHSFELQPL
ncbi:MAG: recombinase family protein, partial [Dehalococcoidia bacterium]|nr:recombinase family protein [Dehalococcoidia bacterium]